MSFSPTAMVPINKLKWVRKLIEFTTILGTSELEAAVWEEDDSIMKPTEENRLIKIQASRYLSAIIKDEITPTWDAFYFIFRALHTNSATVAAYLRLAKSVFTTFKKENKITPHNAVCVSQILLREIEHPGTITSGARRLTLPGLEIAELNLEISDLRPA